FRSHQQPLPGQQDPGREKHQQHQQQRQSAQERLDLAHLDLLDQCPCGARSAPGQRIDDIQAHRAHGRQRTDQQPDRRHQAQAQRPAAPADRRQMIAPPLAVPTIGPSTAASPSPSTPPSTTSSTDSASTIASTLRLVKPMVLSTASSEVRSRTAWAMVLPVSSSRVKNTAPMIEPTIRPISAICLSWAAIAACSFMVRVSCGEFIDSASIALAAASLRFTSDTRLMYQPTVSSTYGVASAK